MLALAGNFGLRVESLLDCLSFYLLEIKAACFMNHLMYLLVLMSERT